jgi:hypothetical protein
MITPTEQFISAWQGLAIATEFSLFSLESRMYQGMDGWIFTLIKGRRMKGSIGSYLY